VLEAMPLIQARLPFPLTGIDCDNGGEFINHALIGWAADRDLFFTRSRPYRSNDNAHVEQKNGDVVRRHAFHYRYDTATNVKLLNELYGLLRCFRTAELVVFLMLPVLAADNCSGLRWVCGSRVLSVGGSCCRTPQCRR
jgi:hypothetical protein